MLAPEFEVEVTEVGLVIRQPAYRVVPIAILGFLSLPFWALIAIFRSGGHRDEPVLTAIVLSAAALAAIGGYRLRNYLYEPRVTLDPSGLKAQQGSKMKFIPWAEAHVDCYTSPGGVTVAGDSGQKVVLTYQMRDTELVEEYLLRHVSRNRIKFAKDWRGQEFIFPRAA